MQGSMINQLTWLCEIAPFRRSSMPNACSPKRKEPDRNGMQPIEQECNTAERGNDRRGNEVHGCTTVETNRAPTLRTSRCKDRFVSILITTGPYFSPREWDQSGIRCPRVQTPLRGKKLGLGDYRCVCSRMFWARTRCHRSPSDASDSLTWYMLPCCAYIYRL